MLNIVLCEPEIPSNTGNISRTCSVTGIKLHLVKPLGFDISDKALKRAGLDYWEYLDLAVYENQEDFWRKNAGCRFWLASTKAPACYCDVEYKDGDFLIFGKETAGLPESLLKNHMDRCIRIPMLQQTRSLNLSNSVAIIAYEALRQLKFPRLMETSEYLQQF